MGREEGRQRIWMGNRNRSMGVICGERRRWTEDLARPQCLYGLGLSRVGSRASTIFSSPIETIHGCPLLEIEGNRNRRKQAYGSELEYPTEYRATCVICPNFDSSSLIFDFHWFANGQNFVSCGHPPSPLIRSRSLDEDFFVII